jgi:inner membrane protein
MNRTHSTCGAAAGAWLAVVAQPSPAYALVGVGVGALAARAPDWDHLDAAPVRAWTLYRWRCKGLRIFGWSLIPKFTFRIGVGPVISWLLRLVSKLTTGVKHRGASHSLLFALLLGLGTFGLAGIWLPLGLSAYLGLAVATGVVSALLGDLVTRAGLDHLLWPLAVKASIPPRLRIKTGGPAEKFVVFPVMVIEIGFGLAQVILGGAWWVYGVVLGGVTCSLALIVLSSTWPWRSSSSSGSRRRSRSGSTRSTARSRSGH